MAVIISQHHRIKMDHEKERKEVYINRQPHIYQKRERSVTPSRLKKV